MLNQAHAVLHARNDAFNRTYSTSSGAIRNLRTVRFCEWMRRGEDEPISR